MITNLIPVALLAFVLTVLVVPLASRLAERVGAVVHPRGDRWSTRTVPMLGGLAIAAGILAGVMISDLPMMDTIAITLGIAAMLVVGLRDDLGTVSPAARLAAQIIVGAGVGWVLGEGLDGPVRLAMTLFAGVAVPVVVNATNLVDNADGLAASLSAASTVGLTAAVVILSLHEPAVAVGLAVTGSCLGFLVHNRPVARTFMGDTGSLSLGFAVAVTGLLLVRDSLETPAASTWAAITVAVVSVAVQLGDATMVTLTRIRRGVSPFKGGVDHTSHRLVALGASNGGMVLLLTALSVALQTLVLIGISVDPDALGLVALAGAAAFTILSIEAWVVHATPQIGAPR